MRRTPVLTVEAEYWAEAQWTPEQRLCAAMLDCAMRDLMYPASTERYRDAWDWMVSAERWTFSFENCCDVLGITPEAFRTRAASDPHWGLRRMREGRGPR